MGRRSKRGRDDHRCEPANPHGLAGAVPAAQGGLGVHGVAVDADLEVEVAADRAGVAGLADGADSLAGLDDVAGARQGPLEQMGVDEVAGCAAVVDEQVVALEVGLVGTLEDAAAVDGLQRGAAGGGDVEALMGAPAVAGGAEVADRAAGAVRAADGEDVGGATAPGGDRQGGQGSQGDQGGGEEALAQRFSMTLSTIL